jgi:hypothetical protein
MTNGSEIRRNRKFLKELSPEASNKLSFNNNIDIPNNDEAETPNTGLADKRVTFNEQNNTTHIINDPMPSLRRSTRQKTQTKRFIEEI